MDLLETSWIISQSLSGLISILWKKQKKKKKKKKGEKEKKKKENEES